MTEVVPEMEARLHFGHHLIERVLRRKIVSETVGQSGSQSQDFRSKLLALRFPFQLDYFTLPALHRMYLCAGAMIVLSWLSIVYAYPLGTIGMGYFLGSLSAQVTLSAAWAALGPTSLAQRLILSIGWVFSFWLAVGITMSINSGPKDIMEMVVVGVFLLVQWLLVQLPLWGLAMGLNVRLRHRDDTPHDTRVVELRFSLRHLFIIMSIAGLLLGIGRVVVPSIDFSGGGREIPIFVFLAVASVVMTFPLLVATLMQRMAVTCAFLSLMFIGVATVAELPLYQQLGGSRPAAGAFIAINTFSALVVLSVAAVVRLNGFSLQRKSKATAA